MTELHEPDVTEGERAESQRLKEGVLASFGMFPTPPGLETEDFDDLIEEVMSNHADWVVQRMRAGLE